MKQFVMMVGIPCSGKSTFVRDLFTDWVVLSTDDYIETKAKEEGKTYGEVFDRYIKSAEKHMECRLQEAIGAGHNIVWDQTNGTVKSRAKKLAKIPGDYQKVAIVTSIQIETALKRNTIRASLTGKHIPESVISSMYNQQQTPTEDEGFDVVLMLYL